MASPHRHRLGVCSWSLRPTDARDLVEKVHAIGLEAVQLALTPLVEEPDRWADAAERLRDAGVTVLSGMLATVGEDYSTIARIAETGGVRPDATWPATRERASRVAEVAGRQGIGLVTFHAGFLPHDRSDPVRTRMIERLADLGRVFADHGVGVAYETGQEPADDLADCLDEIGVRLGRSLASATGVNFDPANMILYGSGDPIVALRRLAPWVRQLHIKDALPSPTPGEWGTEVAAGTGAVAWDAFFASLADCPGRPALVIEREAGDRRLEDVRAAVRLVRAKLDGLGP